jgi:hypothetical protein
VATCNTALHCTLPSCYLLIINVASLLLAPSLHYPLPSLTTSLIVPIHHVYFCFFFPHQDKMKIYLHELQGLARAFLGGSARPASATPSPSPSSRPSATPPGSVQLPVEVAGDAAAAEAHGDGDDNLNDMAADGTLLTPLTPVTPVPKQTTSQSSRSKRLAPSSAALPAVDRRQRARRESRTMPPQRLL